jgi:hypothetical protein
LKYAYLDDKKIYPVIISANLSEYEEERLLKVLRKHRAAIGYTLDDLKGISPMLCQHKINIEPDAKPVVDHQRRLNPKMKDVVRTEILKLLEGFYGTQRYLVVAGRREYAIRASLAAGPDALGRLVLKRGFFLGMPGLIVGGLLSFVFVAWLRDGLVSRDVSPGIVTIGVVAGLALLLVAASLAPARTARRTQPASLLRED